MTPRQTELRAHIYAIRDSGHEPSSGELAAIMGVSRNSVQRMIDRLRLMGELNSPVPVSPIGKDVRGEIVRRCLDICKRPGNGPMHAGKILKLLESQDA